jgi:hypothetical protein
LEDDLDVSDSDSEERKKQNNSMENPLNSPINEMSSESASESNSSGESSSEESAIGMKLEPQIREFSHLINFFLHILTKSICIYINSRNQQSIKRPRKMEPKRIRQATARQ